MEEYLKDLQFTYKKEMKQREVDAKTNRIAAMFIILAIIGFFVYVYFGDNINTFVINILTNSGGCSNAEYFAGSC